MFTFRQLLGSYVLATTAAMGTAIGLNKVAKVLSMTIKFGAYILALTTDIVFSLHLTICYGLNYAN